MGNCSICSDNQRVKREQVGKHERNEEQAKREFKKLAQCPIYSFSSLGQTDVTERFIEFHEKELIQLINKYKFQKAGKDFVQLGYDLTFVSILQLEQSISKDSDLKQLEKLLSRQIRQDIEESKEKSIIYIIVRKFHQFFEQIILEKTENYYYSKQEYSSPDIQYSPTKSRSFELDGINRRTIQHALINDIELSQCIILSIASLFALLKAALNHTYKEIVNQFPTNWDTYIKKEMFLQKIVQHFIYDKQLILGSLLDMALINYYSCDQQQPLHLEDTIEKLTYLDISLYPEPGQITIIKEIEKDSWLMVENSNKQLNDLRSSSRMSLIEMQGKVIKAINEVEKVNLPYKELFVFFQKLMEEKKPYRLYQLMERLNDTIVEVYMTKRPPADLEKYREVILTEDNRLQIILFLIYKFQETSKCDIKKKLYYKLRFMMDFDQVLDKRIKFEMDQSFVRFYACMEMIVQTY